MPRMSLQASEACQKAWKRAPSRCCISAMSEAVGCSSCVRRSEAEAPVCFCVGLLPCLAGQEHLQALGHQVQHRRKVGLRQPHHRFDQQLAQDLRVGLLRLRHVQPQQRQVCGQAVVLCAAASNLQACV